MIQIMNLFLPFAEDCIVSEWSTAGSCSSTCEGGVQPLRRYVLQDAVNGGQACPSLSTFKSCGALSCNQSCPESMEYRLCSRNCTATCSDPNPVCSIDCSSGQCECPSGTVDANGVCVRFQQCSVSRTSDEGFFRSIDSKCSHNNLSKLAVL